MKAIKPVAHICGGWDIRYAGSGPLAGLVKTHGLKIGDPLYAIPSTHRVVPAEPSAAMIDAGVAMALQISVEGEGGWSKYIEALYKQLISAATQPK